MNEQQYALHVSDISLKHILVDYIACSHKLKDVTTHGHFSQTASSSPAVSSIVLALVVHADLLYFSGSYSFQNDGRFGHSHVGQWQFDVSARNALPIGPVGIRSMHTLVFLLRETYI